MLSVVQTEQTSSHTVAQQLAMNDDWFTTTTTTGAIPLILEMGKAQNIHFVGNLILSTSCESYYNDATVMSVINITYSMIPTKSIP